MALQQSRTVTQNSTDPLNETTPGIKDASLNSPLISNPAISVRNVSKMYPLYAHPSDRLKQSLWYTLPTFLRGQPRQFYREFWALKNASFEVQKGEAFGIIGQNGSGKSTLLQIIAGTLTPTRGEVQVNGQVAALLELGSGFNPEFTGRENVYLNGSILGLSREQMDERFDEIAAFANIGEFLDQPVKFYSSGMFVRLAFAVQACVEPDILIIDEALAVGDIFFRQKCYKRLEALKDSGVAIVLVSHSILDVEQFCQRTLLLHHGEAVFLGGASEAIKRYYLLEQSERKTAVMSPPKLESPNDLQTGPAHNSTESHFWPFQKAFLDISRVAEVSTRAARCTGVALCNAQGQPCHIFQQGETASFFYEFELLEDIEVPIGGVVLQNHKGVLVHGKNTLQYDSKVPAWVKCSSRLRFRQDITLEIATGEYSFEVGLATISNSDYQNRSYYSNTELHTKTTRLCHLPAVGRFAVAVRHKGTPVQLLHHGVANLPGNCQVMMVNQD
jgi:lipopolysaccharide transport system ATP-binding protein